MKTLIKWVLRIAIGIIAILFIAGFAMVMIGGSKANQTFNPVDGLLSSVPTDSTSLARGAHLANILACKHCHGESLAGDIMADVPPFKLTSSNLTPGNGSAILDYSVEDWDRAIRHGVKPDGSRILIMPSISYHKLSDEDASHLIAHLQTLTPIDNDVPSAELKSLGKILLATGAPFFETEVSPTDVAAVQVGPTLDYGRYLGSIICKGCHGDNFEGGQGEDPNIPAPSLQVASQWDMPTFARTLRTGVKPNGDSLSVTMPSKVFQHLTDDEVSAIYQYLNQSF